MYLYYTISNLANLNFNVQADDKTIINKTDLR